MGMNKLLEEKNYFCMCGHLKSNHIPLDGHIEIYCKMCNLDNMSPIMHNFKLDNLRYLEEVSKDD